MLRINDEEPLHRRSFIIGEGTSGQTLRIKANDDNKKPLPKPRESPHINFAKTLRFLQKPNN